MTSRTLYDKIWDDHVVRGDDADALLYVDLHLIHEVTTPQAFAGLELAGRAVRRPDRTLAIADHNVPTAGQAAGIAAVADPESRLQLETFDANVRARAIDYLPMGHADNGIVHVVGPELGRSRPGMVIVCGDSHTSTHGAFGALAFGIGTSEVEHVLATQTLRTGKARNMAVEIVGTLAPHVGAKDIALALIAQIGTNGGTGAVIEYRGPVVDALSMEARMTLCNMSIEAGARAGLIAPDATTHAYLATRPGGAAQPPGRATPRSDADAVFDRSATLDMTGIGPMVTWGTNPAQAIAIHAAVPDPATLPEPERAAAQRALAYMDVAPGRPLTGLAIDLVFIGSCTNSRIEDLRAAAAIARDGRVAPGVRALVVPGSRAVRRQAEAEGLDLLFTAAGFEWREPGCSMCLGMNPDKLKPGERCAATSNRNFEGRQGPGGRTHLMSPAMAAAAALAGCIVDVRAVRP
jgi:3-isopropylmalate/(R)-2-methylmalate dehydratase large subunit